jgi:long-chain acyl-CoA synthetase
MLKGWIAANNKAGATIDTLVNDPDLHAVIQTAVDEANKAVSKAESIRKFTILAKDFTIASGELTAKISLKSHVIAEHYATEIAALFTK